MQYDVVIVGGGLVGSSLACALTAQGLKSAVIEKMPAKVSNPHPTNAKALALSRPSVYCLENLQVWSKVASMASTLREVHVSSKGHFGMTRIQAEKEGLTELGFVIDADILNHLLLETMGTRPEVTLYRPAEIIELKPGDEDFEHWTLTLNSGETLSAKLLVAADGADSLVCRQQGIQRVNHHYPHVAIITNVMLAQSHEGVAFERFTQQGSLAMIPFGEHRVKCVWVVPEETGVDLLNMNDTEFLNRLQLEFGYRLGKLKSVSVRTKFPLKSSYAETLYGHRFVLVGNAANTVHPVAAQGFNLGLRDVATLAEILGDARKHHKDIGAIDLLRAYADQRRGDHETTRAFSHRLTQSNVGLSVGIVACELMDFMKKRVFQLGLGAASDLPKLCRGIQ